MGMSGEHNALASLPRGKTPYAMYRRLVGPQGRYGWAREISQSYVSGLLAAAAAHKPDT